MAMVAHDPKAAKRVGISQSVGRDYVEADKGKKFGSGGVTRQKIGNPNTRHGKFDLPYSSLKKYAGMAEGGDVKESKAMVKKEVSFMKKKGAPKSMIKHEEAEMGMKAGGMADKMGRALVKKAGAGRAMMKYAEGGSVYRSAADGITARGKTKGKMVKMKMGGKC
jgi:hypothetical protein